MKKIFIKSGISLLALLSLGSVTIARQYINENLSHKTSQNAGGLKQQEVKSGGDKGGSGQDQVAFPAAFESKDETVDETKEIEKLLHNWKAKVKKRQEDKTYLESDEGKSRFEEWKELIKNDRLEEYKQVWEFYRIYKFAKNIYQNRDDDGEDGSFEKKIKQLSGLSQKKQDQEIFNILHNDEDNIKEKVAALYIEDLKQSKILIKQQLKQIYKSDFALISISESELFKIWNQNNVDGTMLLKIYQLPEYKNSKWIKSNEYQKLQTELKDPANTEIDHEKLKLKWLKAFRLKPQNRSELFKLFNQDKIDGLTALSFKASLKTSSWFENYKLDQWYDLNKFKNSKVKFHYQILLLDEIFKSKKQTYNIFANTNSKLDYKLWLDTNEGHDYIKESFANSDWSNRVYQEVVSHLQNEKHKKTKLEQNLTPQKWKKLIDNFDFNPQDKNKEFSYVEGLLKISLKKYQKNSKDSTSLEGMKLYNLFVWKQILQKMSHDFKQLDELLGLSLWGGFDGELKKENDGGYKTLKNYKANVAQLGGVSPIAFREDDIDSYYAKFWNHNIKIFTKDVLKNKYLEKKVLQRNKKEFIKEVSDKYQNQLDFIPPFIYGNKDYYTKSNMSDFEKKINTKNIPRISLRVKDKDEALNFNIAKQMYDDQNQLTLIGKEVWNYIKINFNKIYQELGADKGLWIVLSDDKKEPHSLVGWRRDETAYNDLDYKLSDNLSPEWYLYNTYFKEATSQGKYDYDKLALMEKIFFSLWIYNNLDQVTKYLFASKVAHFKAPYEKNKKWKTTKYYQDFERDYSIRKYLLSSKDKKDEAILENYTMDRLQEYAQAIIPWEKEITYSHNDYDKWLDDIETKNPQLLQEIFKNSAYFGEDLAIKESDKVRKEFETKLTTKKESSTIVNLVKKWFLREHVPTLEGFKEFVGFEATTKPEEFLHIFKENEQFKKILNEEWATFTKSYDNQVWLATHRPTHPTPTANYKGWLDTQDFRDSMLQIMRQNSTYKDPKDGVHKYMLFNNAVMTRDYQEGKHLFTDNISYHLLQDSTLKAIFNDQKSPVKEWKKLIDDAVDRASKYKEKYPYTDWNKGIFGAKWTHFYLWQIPLREKGYQKLWEEWKKTFTWYFSNATNGYKNKYTDKQWMEILFTNQLQKATIKNVNLKFVDNRYAYASWSYWYSYLIPDENTDAKRWQINWASTKTNLFLQQLITRLQEDKALEELNALAFLEKKGGQKFVKFDEEFAQEYFEKWIEDEFKGYMINKRDEAVLKWDEVEGEYEEFTKNKEEWNAFIDAISEKDLRKNEYFDKWIKDKVQTSSNYYRWYEIYHQIKGQDNFYNQIKTLRSKSKDKTLDIINDPKVVKLITQIYNQVFKDDFASEKQKVKDKIWQQYSPSLLKEDTLAQDWTQIKKQHPAEVAKFVKHDNLVRKNYLGKKYTTDQYYDWIWKNYHQQISDTLISNLINDKKWSSIKGFKDFKYDIYTHNVRPDVYSIKKDTKISQSIFELFTHHFDISHLYRSGAKEKEEMKRIYNNFRNVVHKFNGPLSKGELKKLRDDEKDYQQGWGILNKKKVWWYPYMGKWEEILDQPRTKLHQDFNRIIVKLYLHLEDKKLHPQIENKFYDYATGKNQLGRFLKWYQSENGYQKAFDNIIDYSQTFATWFKDESYDPELVELFNHGFKSAASNYDFGEKWTNSQEYKSLSTVNFGKLSYEQIQLQHFRKWKAKNSKLFYKAFIDDSLVSKMDAFSTSTANKDYGKITTDVFDRVKLDKFLTTDLGKQAWNKELGLRVIPKLQSQLTTYNQYQEITSTPDLTLDEAKAKQWFEKLENQKAAFVSFIKSPYSDAALKEINETEKYKVKADDWSKQLDHYLKEHVGKSTGPSYKGKKLKILEKYWTLFKDTKVEYGQYYWNEIFQALTSHHKKMERKVNQLVKVVDKNKDQNPLLETEFLRQEIVKTFAPDLSDHSLLHDYNYKPTIANHRYLSQQEAIKEGRLFKRDEKFENLVNLYHQLRHKMVGNVKVVAANKDQLQPYYWNWYQKNFAKILKLFETKNKVIDGKNVNKLWLNSSQNHSYEWIAFPKGWKPLSIPKAHLPYYKNKFFDTFAQQEQIQDILWSLFKTKGAFGSSNRKQHQEKQSPYQLATTMHYYLGLIDPEQEKWRDFLDDFKIKLLTDRLGHLFPLGQFDFSKASFEKWKTYSHDLLALKEEFKKSKESQAWRSYYNDWGGFDWISQNLHKYPQILDIPYFKKALTSWILSQTKISSKIKKPSSLLDLAKSPDDVLNKLDAYYDLFRDNQLLEFKPVADDFDTSVLLWQWFNPWLDQMIKSKFILEDITVIDDGDQIFNKWSGFGKTKEYKDYLEEIKKPLYKNNKELKENKLITIFRKYINGKSEEKAILQRKLKKIYKSKRVYYLNKGIKTPLPLITLSQRWGDKVGHLSQYDVDYFKFITKKYNKGEEEIKSLLNDLFYLKRFMISDKGDVNQHYPSLDAFWKDAFTTWTKDFDFNTIKTPSVYDALRVFKEYYYQQQQ